MNNLKFITIISILINLSSINYSYSDQQTQSIEHNATSPQFVDFIYNQPINGITISGRFVPFREDYQSSIQPYYGRYMGSAEITFTRLSDFRSTTREFREVSFVSSDHCLNKNPINECLLESPLFLEPTYYTDSSHEYLPDIGLNILDYDYDNKQELILIMPFGYRGGPEFFVHDIIDTEEDFSIGYDIKIPGNVEFDIENKLMTYNYSSGSCLTDYYHYKAEGLEGYKRYKIINYDREEVNGEHFCKKTVYLE
jgi:hypothetical protein